MTDQRKEALQYAQANRQRFLDELKELASIPSVSTSPEHEPDIQRAAGWLADQLRSLGMEHVEIFPIGGHPVVYGESLGAGPGAPTVLLYGHYDVQPAEPLELWKSPPFEPTQQGEDLVARGISDMKGQVMVGLKAIESVVRTGRLPVNVKAIFEGEEEIGSPHLGPFIAGHKDLLASDFALNLDSGLVDEETPAITYGLRGLAYFELRIAGPSHDLHSGIYGGSVHNPAQVLCELIAGMHDEHGRVTLPGFYDKVRPVSSEEREELARLPTGEAYYLEQTGVPALYGEAGYTATEQVGARPTLEVNGLLSGFTGEGQKTVLPARAMAKISTRLVPDQDPEQVYQQLLKYLEIHAPKTITWEVVKMAGGPASISDRSMPAIQAYSQALETVWGKRPVFRREGGSIPVVADMQNILGIGSVVGGFSTSGDNQHAPNEKFYIPNYFRGIDAVINFFFNLGER